MKKIKENMYIIYTLIFVIATALISIWVYNYYTEVDSISFAISSLSLIIALISFFISLNTYLSIDNVNKITRMEGNILENTEYTLSLPELLDKYQQEDVNDLAYILFEELKYRFKKDSDTSIAFTNHLQYLTDVLVFFPAIFNSTKSDHTFNEKKNELLKIIRKRQKKLNAIVSTGDLIQVDEAIKLIEGVFSYQKFNLTKGINPGFEILKVRGSILKNAVTRTVYYNYLGLFYNKKALVQIQTIMGLENKNLLQKMYAKRLYDELHNIADSDKEIIRMFLDESINSFIIAKESAKNDLMWSAYIDYNLGRTLFYLEALDKADDTLWMENINNAVASRNKLNVIIKEIIPEKQTHLTNHYIYQELLARLVRVHLLSASGKSMDIQYETQSILNGHEDIVNEYDVLKQYTV